MLWLSRIRGFGGSWARSWCGLAFSALALLVVAALPPTRAQSPAVNLFLHGSGATANPATLFLNASTPTGGTAYYKDSAALNFAGGNAWKEIGSWAVAPNSIANGDLNALGPLRVWVGLKNSDDQGT